MVALNMRDYRGRMRLRRCAPLVALCGVSLLGMSPAVAAPSVVKAAVPSNWVHHVESPWAWFTPAHWVDSHGANDLNISSPTGSRWAKFGFSGAIYYNTLTPRGNAEKWFRDLRRNYRTGSVHSFGLYSMPLRSDKYTRIGPIRAVAPPSGFGQAWTQSLTFKGVRTDGVPIQGEMFMEYAANPPSAFDPYGNAGESFRVNAAPTRGYSSSINTLRIVQQHVTYCGSIC